MPEPNIIPNAQLTADDRASILRRYVNRHTIESPWANVARKMAGKPAATLTDQQWIDARIWQRLPDGSVSIVE